MADEQLAPFVIPSESLQDGSGTSIGSGSYGAVFEIRMNGLPCIAKRLHAILTSTQLGSLEDREAIHKRFRDECILLSRLRHPNIVQFLGVHYGSDRYDLSLVMERMHMDLEKALEKFPNMSPSIKLRILLDASYGLMHLHCQTPPIVHRDFTAANVLLSPDMRAKIADLGVSKILDLSPHQLSKLTKCPGALGYMPPEALKLKPVYDVKLDVFSFGHLALYTVNQQFPEVYELEPEAHEELRLGTAQLAKRTVAIDMMGKDHCLHQLVTDCLQDSPEKRPTTSQVNSTLQDLAAQHPVKDPHVIPEKTATTHCGCGLRVRVAELQTIANIQDGEITALQQENEELRIKAETSESAESRYALNAKVSELQRTVNTQKDEISTLKHKNKELLSESETIKAEALSYKTDYEDIISKTKRLLRSKKEKWSAKLRRKSEKVKREKEMLETELHCAQTQLDQSRKLLETLASQNDTKRRFRTLRSTSSWSETRSHTAGRPTRTRTQSASHIPNYAQTMAHRRISEQKDVRPVSLFHEVSRGQSGQRAGQPSSTHEQPSRRDSGLGSGHSHSTLNDELITIGMSAELYQKLTEGLESSSDEEEEHASGGHWLDTESLPPASSRRMTSPARLMGMHQSK